MPEQQFKKMKLHPVNKLLKGLKIVPVLIITIFFFRILFAAVNCNLSIKHKFNIFILLLNTQKTTSVIRLFNINIHHIIIWYAID